MRLPARWANTDGILLFSLCFTSCEANLPKLSLLFYIFLSDKLVVFYKLCPIFYCQILLFCIQTQLDHPPIYTFF